DKVVGRKKRILRDLPAGLGVTLAAILLWAFTGRTDVRQSTRGWECIAPAAAGGGWDLTCRAASRALLDLGLYSGVMRVINLPGAGGGIAYAHTVAQRAGDEEVLVAASPATTLRLAQGQFAHLTEHDVRWVGAIAADYGVVAVAPNAPWLTLEEF